MFMNSVTPYLAEFLTIASVHLLAVASPGPDFAITMQQSVARGRRAGILTSLGIGAGIFVHVAYCVVGIGVLISQSILLFQIVKLIGAAYLVLLGISAIRSKPRGSLVPAAPHPGKLRHPFTLGFLTNAFNPKATLFFLSVFSVVVSQVTPLYIQVGYGVWMAVVTALWFSGLSMLFSLGAVRGFLVGFGHWFDRVMGAVLIALGLRLALSGHH
jgi:RhtB (resistance to homoserine/threonine) family protein